MLLNFHHSTLSWLKTDELIEKDILSIDNLPSDFPLTENQRVYVDMVLNDQPEIDAEAIRNKLSELEYPIHFFDFESYNPAIPRFKELRPYQQFPFQYSCHILQSDGSLTHREYLHIDTTDPRLPLVESLLDHISDMVQWLFIRLLLNEEYFRTWSNLSINIPKNFNQLLPDFGTSWRYFRNHYKHPEFYGSNSLKNVLPVLVPCLSYEGLGIQEGDDAQAVWNTMIQTTDEEARNNMINNLKEYCEMDTLAMVKIHKALLQL